MSTRTRAFGGHENFVLYRATVLSYNLRTGEEKDHTGRPDRTHRPYTPRHISRVGYIIDIAHVRNDSYLKGLPSPMSCGALQLVV